MLYFHRFIDLTVCYFTELFLFPFALFPQLFELFRRLLSMQGVAIAQWIRLRPPSCAQGSSPKHAIYAFINLY